MNTPFFSLLSSFSEGFFFKACEPFLEFRVKACHKWEGLKHSVSSVQLGDSCEIVISVFWLTDTQALTVHLTPARCERNTAWVSPASCNWSPGNVHIRPMLPCQFTIHAVSFWAALLRENFQPIQLSRPQPLDFSTCKVIQRGLIRPGGAVSANRIVWFVSLIV